MIETMKPYMKAWRLGGPPLIVLLIAVGFMSAGQFEGSLALAVFGSVTWVALLTKEQRRRDHQECLAALESARARLDQLHNERAAYELATMTYLASDGTESDRHHLLDSIEAATLER